jgi:hypothetical protein
MIQVNTLTVKLNEGVDLTEFQVYISSIGRYVGPTKDGKHIIQLREFSDIPREYGTVVIQ